MRDAFKKAGVHVPTRENGHNGPRPQSNRPPGTGSSKRSTSRAANLYRLGKELEYDLLSSALCVGEQTLRNLAQDRPQGTDEQSLVQIAVKLKQAGFPPAWLDTPNAHLYPNLLAALRKLATQSSSKAAVRRMHLKQLAQSFRDRMELLADALEISVTSLSSIIDGNLEFDDQRAGHINPKLVTAGFPDGWLEQSDAVLTDDMVRGLETLATDAYEQELSEAEHLRNQLHIATIEASNDTGTAEQDDIPATAVGAKAPVASKPVAVAPGQPSLAASEPVASQTALFPESEQPRQATPELIHVAPQPGVASEAPQAVTSQMPRAKETRTPVLPQVNDTKEVTMAKSTSTAPTPRSSRVPAAAPVPVASGTAGTNRPGSRLASLRSVMKSAVVPGSAAPASAAGSVAAKKAALNGAPVKTAAKKATAVKTAPAAKKAGKASNVAKFVRHVSTLDTPQSLKRSKALDELLSNSRRSAKVTLWRTILGSSQAYAGNIRQGMVLLKDDYADKIEQALHLPQGWLDNPVFPPPSLAPWVTDATVPLPGSLEDAINGTSPDAPPRKAAKGTPAPVHREMPAAPPVPRTAAKSGTKSDADAQPAQQSLLDGAAHDAASQQSAVAEAAPQAAAPVAGGKIGSIGRRPTRPSASISVPAAPAAAPVASAAHSPVGGGFTWVPAADPQSEQTPGPLVMALTSVLTKHALAGTFTEDDALALLNYLRDQSRA